MHAPLHAHQVRYQFSTAPPGVSTLIARARQFSSFVLVLGSLAAGDEFLPLQALIMQNKDVRSVAVVVVVAAAVEVVGGQNLLILLRNVLMFVVLLVVASE
jgi:hypothetical protein